MNVSCDSSPRILVCQERVISQKERERKRAREFSKGSKVYFKGVKIIELAPITFEVGVKVLGCGGRSVLDAK